MNQKNCCQAITNVHAVLKQWRMKNIFTEDKFVISKTLAIYRLVYLALLTVNPNHTIDKVAKIQKSIHRMIHPLKLNMKH